MLSVAGLAVVAEEPNKPLIVGLIVLCMAGFSFANGDLVEGRMDTQPTSHCLICHLVLVQVEGWAYLHTVTMLCLATSLSRCRLCAFFVLS